MYQAPKGYTSPPPLDPYRSSPIPVAGKQVYQQAFSPPPPPNAFLPVGQQQRYHQAPYPIGSAGSGSSSGTHHVSRQSSSNRYAPQPHPARSAYQNGYPQAPPHGAGAGAPAQQPRHKGTLAPGTMIQIGENMVKVERYLSEGGYAHVYLTSSEKPIYLPTKSEKRGRWGEVGYTEHCLKRIAFEDDSVWVDVKREIEVMKSLPPNPHLVQYLGSVHNRTSKGGHEVFILMEFCAGGGIIDLLNKRLRDRLQESEILCIFTDACEAVAAMHALKQPLLHRDLKIENVLSHPSTSSSTRPMPLVFKLCDFGSTTFPATRPPTTKIEADALAMDLNRHTTLQYRSPEMVEPMLGHPVGLPSDVWALGVFLYKLCYYTTPFEEHGTLAIVNAKYTFPQYPVYSPKIQHLIASMLIEQPIRRPTVFDILITAHDMSGTKPEVDYPASASRSFAHQAPSKPSISTANTAGTGSNLLDFTSPTSPVAQPNLLTPSLASTVQPGRRGRPTRETSSNNLSTQLPPMPKPPTITQPTPTPTSAPASSTTTTSASRSHLYVHPRARTQISGLQVTGETSKVQSPSPSASLDAFGMPSNPAPQKSGTGFSDSFSGQRAFQPTSKFGQSLNREQSGFADSFSAKSPALSPQKIPVAPAADGTSSVKSQVSSPLLIPKVTSPDIDPNAKSAPEEVSKEGGEVNFETRFPSLETLNGSGDAELLDQKSAAAPTVAPKRPGLAGKPSIMGNLTGGNVKYPHITTEQNGAPQPRSTHVTGTAFKGGNDILSPVSVKAHAGYFDTSFEPLPVPSPVPDASAQPQSGGTPADLMSSESGYELQAPLLPTDTKSSTSPRSFPSHAGPAQIPPQSGHSRPLLPKIDSARPHSNIDSPYWSPLEQMKSKENREKALAAARSPDSSDDETGPENASRPSATRLDSSRGFNRGGPTSTQQEQVEPASPPAQNGTAQSTSRGPSTSNSGAGVGRPQSMYTLPSSSAQQPLSGSSNGGASGAGLSAGSSPRPSHVRKGSITDMVSKFESLKPSSSPAISRRISGSAPGQGQTSPSNATALSKPSSPVVAAKPAAFRRPTLSSPTAETAPAPSNATRTSAPAPAVRHGEAPKPEGYSRTSSGRAFPIVKPKPQFGSATPTASAVPAAGSDAETQQPVNALIARWNKGEVGSKPVIKPKPAF